MTGSDAAGVNAAQAAFWTEGPGRIWAAEQARLDVLMAPLTATLLARADIRPGERALDIGCGAGDTTLAMADRVGPRGTVTGLDISPTLLGVARHRAGSLANVKFLEADAQTHPCPPDAYDLILSRFGVMFFSDPVAAFRNLAATLQSGGRIVFVTWSSPAVNPWVREPRAAAEARLGQVPADPPRTPGMFAFADRDYVAGLLADAGFTRIEAQEMQTELHVDGGAAEAAALAATIGPVNYVMRVRSGTEADRTAITDDIAARFRRFETPDGVRVPAVMNLFSARRP